MAQVLSKEAFLKAVEQGRENWEKVLAQVEPDHLSEPGVTGAWSVKDLLAHTTVWQSFIVARLEAQARGERYVPDETEKLEVEARNQTYYRVNRDRPLEEVIASEKATYSRLLELVSALPEEALTTPGYFSWAGKDPFQNWVAGDTYEHYGEHAATIHEWLQNSARS